MQAFSIIDVPKYQQKALWKTVRSMSIDYKRFNIRDRKILEGLFVNSYRADNETNTNVIYDWNIAFLRVKSPRGIAHQIIATAEEVGAIPIAYVEVYGVWQGLRGSVGRVDFYGAFFHFLDDLPQRYKNLYNHLMELSKKWDKKVWVTRVDVAMDFDYPFPQNGHLWIDPAKTSKRNVEVRYHHKLVNSVAYLAEKNSGYWVRIYNKALQVDQKNKQSWYGWAEKIPENWTRIEFEFYNPYSSKDEEELKLMCVDRILWRKVAIGLPSRPTYNLNIESAYKYFERYAKNHGVTIKQLLDELVAHHEYLEKSKDYYWLVE